MRVTEFRDYLACPYRYYLRHRLRLARSEGRGRGTRRRGVRLAGPRGAGRVRPLGRRPRRPTPEEIAAFLDAALGRGCRASSTAARRCRRSCVQVEQLRARLRALRPMAGRLGGAGLADRARRDRARAGAGQPRGRRPADVPPRADRPDRRPRGDRPADDLRLQDLGHGQDARPGPLRRRRVDRPAVAALSPPGGRHGHRGAGRDGLHRAAQGHRAASGWLPAEWTEDELRRGRRGGRRRWSAASAPSSSGRRPIRRPPSPRSSPPSARTAASARLLADEEGRQGDDE